MAVEEARRAAKLPKSVLQKFTEKDNVESVSLPYEEMWAAQLAGMLSGDALDSYSTLAPASARDYDLVKADILKRYDVSAETY